MINHMELESRKVRIYAKLVIQIILIFQLQIRNILMSLVKVYFVCKSVVFCQSYTHDGGEKKEVAVLVR